MALLVPLTASANLKFIIMAAALGPGVMFSAFELLVVLSNLHDASVNAGPVANLAIPTTASISLQARGDEDWFDVLVPARARRLR